MQIANPFGPSYEDLQLPDTTEIVTMDAQEPLPSVEKAIVEALAHPIACEPLHVMAKRKLQENPAAKAVIVVSDNTRPVPYTGKQGILWPIVDILIETGFSPERITILIATGTHRAMTESEITTMVDEKVLQAGVKVVNHDCRDKSCLTDLGTTKRGTRILVDSRYVEADLKIATGLVESHFMAGASGGRKAICPGLIGEDSTYVFHGAKLMADPASRDLNLTGNPVHEESLAVAETAGVDFLANVTLDHAFRITGIFFGDLEAAHEAAVRQLVASVRVAVPTAADVVITHGGFVGINHYQCAKCAVGSLGILKPNGYLVIIANLTDEHNLVGSINYRTALALLKLQGTEGFLRTIFSNDWTFIPEQWQVQQWAKVFKRIPQDHLIFYSPQLDAFWWSGLPGINGADLLKREVSKATCYTTAIEEALRYIETKSDKSRNQLHIAYINDGPYVVPHTVDPSIR